MSELLDEADHMADLSFLPVVRRLLDMTPPDGQRMLFSATLDAAVDVLARRFMTRPAHHDVGVAEAPVTMVHHPLTIAPADRVGVVAALAGGSGRSLLHRIRGGGLEHRSVFMELSTRFRNSESAHLLF